MDLITTGVSSSERMRRESLIQDTRNLIMEKMQIGGRSMRLLEVLITMLSKTIKYRSCSI
jgi:DNA replication licensing factor MCM4